MFAHTLAVVVVVRRLFIFRDAHRLHDEREGVGLGRVLRHLDQVRVRVRVRARVRVRVAVALAVVVVARIVRRLFISLRHLDQGYVAKGRGPLPPAHARFQPHRVAALRAQLSSLSNGGGRVRARGSIPREE